MTGPDSSVRTVWMIESAVSRDVDVSVVTSLRSIDAGISERRFRRRILRLGEFIRFIKSVFLPEIRVERGQGLRRVANCPADNKAYSFSIFSDDETLAFFDSFATDFSFSSFSTVGLEIQLSLCTLKHDNEQLIY